MTGSLACSVTLASPAAATFTSQLLLYGSAVGKSTSAAADLERSADKKRRGGRLGTLTVAACAAADW